MSIRHMSDYLLVASLRTRAPWCKARSSRGPESEPPRGRTPSDAMLGSPLGASEPTKRVTGTAGRMLGSNGACARLGRRQARRAGHAGQAGQRGQAGQAGHAGQGGQQGQPGQARTGKGRQGRQGRQGRAGRQAGRQTGQARQVLTTLQSSGSTQMQTSIRGFLEIARGCARAGRPSGDRQAGNARYAQVRMPHGGHDLCTFSGLTFTWWTLRLRYVGVWL